MGRCHKPAFSLICTRRKVSSRIAQRQQLLATRQHDGAGIRVVVGYRAASGRIAAPANNPCISYVSKLDEFIRGAALVRHRDCVRLISGPRRCPLLDRICASQCKSEPRSICARPFRNSYRRKNLSRAPPTYVASLHRQRRIGGTQRKRLNCPYFPSIG